MAGLTSLHFYQVSLSLTSSRNVCSPIGVESRSFNSFEKYSWPFSYCGCFLQEGHVVLVQIFPAPSKVSSAESMRQMLSLHESNCYTLVSYHPAKSVPAARKSRHLQRKYQEEENISRCFRATFFMAATLVLPTLALKWSLHPTLQTAKFSGVCEKILGDPQYME